MSVMKNVYQIQVGRSHFVSPDQRFRSLAGKHAPWSHCGTSRTPPPPENYDFGLVLYYKSDKIHFKETVFSECIEIITQAASGTSAGQRH
jgi:hypothetical protein